MTVIIASFARKLIARTWSALRARMARTRKFSSSDQGPKMYRSEPPAAIGYRRTTALLTLSRGGKLVNRRHRSRSRLLILQVYLCWVSAIKYVIYATEILAVVLTTTPSGKAFQINLRRLTIEGVTILISPDLSNISILILLIDANETIRAGKECFKIAHAGLAYRNRKSPQLLHTIYRRALYAAETIWPILFQTH
jgi:hypothetical protein